MLVALAALLPGCDGCGAAQTPGPLTPDERTRFHIADRLGSSALALDHEGTVTARDGHLPYGERWFQWRGPGEQGPTYSFTGSERDPTGGSVAIGARHYLPPVGRWASPDPLFSGRAGSGALLGRPRERNPYRYGGHDPTTHTDPSGLSIWSRLAKAANKLRKGGRVVEAFAEVVRDAKTVVDADASTGDRLRAGLSLASEGLPASIRDVKAIARGARTLIRALRPKPIRRALAPAVPVRGSWKPKGRFVGDGDGHVVDTDATKPGRYIQPDGSKTDILQKKPHPTTDQGSAYSHTHTLKTNVDRHGKVFKNKTGDTQGVTATEVSNIASGYATRAPPVRAKKQ